ncbi:uncharacterized protein [Dysidea avara]|uniref:uncharacterized protein n=1 Tax=Dysidea avara TaxID=196820 RepID=UPI0033180730
MAGQRRYLHFCKAVGIKPLPGSEGALTLFTTHLAVSNVSHGTIKVYLSAVRHLHICKGLHGHFSQQLTPRLHLILRGIKKRQADVHSRRKRLPITTQLLGKIRHLLSKQPTYDNTTLWAMCCLAFFGLLRVSEFTIPSKGSYNPSRHLSLQDVTVDNRIKPRLLQLFLKQSKTDPFKQGAQVYVGATDTTICPVKAVLSYLARRNSRPGPIFITKEGKGWTNSMFRSALQSLMGKLKLNRHHYNTHSFRIGAATSASLANISDTHIQMLGRWKSNAFQRYIRPPPTEVAKLSKSIATGNQ